MTILALQPVLRDVWSLALLRLMSQQGAMSSLRLLCESACQCMRKLSIRLSRFIVAPMRQQSRLTNTWITMTTRLISNAKQWSHTIKRDVHAVWLAARDPRTPWFAKALALVIAAYAVSPIDLIPDFIPVLGYLDDLVIVPLGILLVVRLIPPEVMEEYRESAAKAAERPVSRLAAGVVIALWVACAALLVRLFI